MIFLGGITMSSINFSQPYDLLSIDDIFRVKRILRPDSITIDDDVTIRYVYNSYRGSKNDIIPSEILTNRLALVKKEYVSGGFMKIIVSFLKFSNVIRSGNSEFSESFVDIKLVPRENFSEAEYFLIKNFYKKTDYTRYFKSTPEKVKDCVNRFNMSYFNKIVENSTERFENMSYLDRCNSYNATPRSLHSIGMGAGIIPIIDNVYFNNPYTTVKWKDHTTTTVKCTDGEVFNKEIGLAMAISKKYLETFGFPYPRSAFKSIVNNAVDQSAKTAAKKAYKEAKKQKLLKAGESNDE